VVAAPPSLYPHFIEDAGIGAELVVPANARRLQAVRAVDLAPAFRAREGQRLKLRQILGMAEINVEAPSHSSKLRIDKMVAVGVVEFVQVLWHEQFPQRQVQWPNGMGSFYSTVERNGIILLIGRTNGIILLIGLSRRTVGERILRMRAADRLSRP
jgi:hypothetical protein